MGSIDDIKKKLNIDNLDKNSRANMYNKFVEKGGKVIEEKQKNAIHFNRDKQKMMLKQEEIKKKKYQQKDGQGQSNEKGQSNYRYSYKKDEKEGDQNTVKRSFFVFFEGVFRGIFTLSGIFSRKFSFEIFENLITLLTELKQITQQTLSINIEKKWEAIDVINFSNPYAYEIIMRFDSLYEMDQFDIIIRYFKNQNKIACNAGVLGAFFKFYKNLLILYPYWETVKSVLWDAQQYHQDLNGVSPVMSRAKIHKYADKLFSYYFPRILIILNYGLGRKVPFEFKSMFDFASVTPEEDMSSITNLLAQHKKIYFDGLKKEKEKKMKEMKDDIDKKDQDKIPKYIQKGLEAVDSIIANIGNIMINDRNLKNFESNEKMLQLYCLIVEFDRLYSFILTTSQIKYEPLAEAGIKIDIKAELDNLYIKFNEILVLIKEYTVLNAEFHKLNEGNNINSRLQEQEIKNINIKRAQSYNDLTARNVFFFKKFAIMLQKVIQDYDGDKKLLKNGDDKLHFEIKTSANPMFEKVKIINAVILTFSFASAVHYYLTRGKLSEKGLYFNE